MTEIFKYESPKWFNLDTAKLLDIYDDETFQQSSCFKNDNNIKYKIYKTNKNGNFEFEKNTSQETIYNKTYDELTKKYNKKIESEQNETKKKTLITKLQKKINEINTVTRVKQIPVNFNDKQKNIIQEWILECKKVYNYCIDKLDTDNKYFNKGYKAIKANLLSEIYGNSDKPVPYDVVSDEIRIMTSNLKSCFTNLKNKNIKKFKLGKKKMKKGNYSLLIPSKSIQQNSIFKNILGKIENFDINFDITHDSRLFYNNYENTYILMIPCDVKCKIIKNRESICSIDPGEKKFIEFVGEKSHGFIGKNMRKILLKIRNRISKLQKILSKNKNKKGDKIKNKKQIKGKIKKMYKKIKNIVKELHNQTADYLCKNYEKILIPKFETQKMIRKKTFKDHKKEVINKGKNHEERKKIAKEFTKKCRLSKKVKYVLNTLSHFSFRQHLLNKAQEYGCEVKVVTEEYTSMTCSKCGHLSSVYENRIKKCENCDKLIDRDLNGAINILHKNISVFKHKAIKPKATCVPKSVKTLKKCIINDIIV